MFGIIPFCRNNRYDLSESGCEPHDLMRFFFSDKSLILRFRIVCKIRQREKAGFVEGDKDLVLIVVLFVQCL